MFRQRPSGREKDQLERLEKFQEARAAYVRACDIKTQADHVHEEAKSIFERARGELRKVSEEAWPQ